MDVNQKFEEILVENKIIKKTYIDKAVKVVQDLEKSFMSGGRIGIYGVGIEAEGLLNFIAQNITCLRIDSCFDRLIRSYKYKDIIRDNIVHPIEQINNMDIDFIIIGSYAYRENFVENLSALGYQGQIVDLYSYMGDYMEEHSADYKKAYWARQAYIKADVSNKERMLQRLIKEYLILKDFQYSFHYIDIYIENRYSDYKQYIKLKDDITLLLKEIKEYIAKRNQRDILINWVDALSYYDIPEFPFLQKKSQEGVCFHNAYTVMPWTTETTKTILFGECPIEGKLFLRDELTIDNVKLLKLLKEYGYKFAYCGMPKFAKLFDKTVIAPVGYFENKYFGSMQKQWDALTVLCKCDSPVCVLIHTLRETHEPYICGEGDTLAWFYSTEKDWNRVECRKQAETAGRYINTQLEFYENLYPDDAVKIYMSDHGRVGNNPMDEKKIHTMLLIAGKGIEPFCVNGMFSFVHFPDLIKKLIEKNYTWNALESEYVIIENLDAYSELVVQDTLSGKMKREEMCQCRGVVTKTDAYYKYAFGKEYYFEKAHPNENKIEQADFNNRINELKELCGNQFIDIFAYDKFEFSRLLYK